MHAKKHEARPIFSNKMNEFIYHLLHYLQVKNDTPEISIKNLH